MHISAAEITLQGIYMMAAVATSQAIIVMASLPPSVGNQAQRFIVYSKILTISVSKQSVGGPSGSVDFCTRFYTKHYTKTYLLQGGE